LTVTVPPSIQIESEISIRTLQRTAVVRPSVSINSLSGLGAHIVCFNLCLEGLTRSLPGTVPQPIPQPAQLQCPSAFPSLSNSVVSVAPARRLLLPLVLCMKSTLSNPLSIRAGQWVSYKFTNLIKSSVYSKCQKSHFRRKCATSNWAHRGKENLCEERKPRRESRSTSERDKNEPLEPRVFALRPRPICPRSART